MNEAKYHSHYGPGGRNCNCCGPSPDTRKEHDRMVMHRVRQVTKTEIMKHLREMTNDQD